MLPTVPGRYILHFPSSPGQVLRLIESDDDMRLIESQYWSKAAPSKLPPCWLPAVRLVSPQIQFCLQVRSVMAQAEATRSACQQVLLRNAMRAIFGDPQAAAGLICSPFVQANTAG